MGESPENSEEEGLRSGDSLQTVTRVVNKVSTATWHRAPGVNREFRMGPNQVGFQYVIQVPSQIAGLRTAF